MEVVRPGPERTVPARSPGSDGTTRYRVVPLARLGLHPEEGHHDDQATRAAADDDDGDKHVVDECGAVK